LRDDEDFRDHAVKREVLLIRNVEPGTAGRRALAILD
jgi:hypothetical protein